jgi:Zn-dependent protease
VADCEHPRGAEEIDVERRLRNLQAVAQHRASGEGSSQTRTGTGSQNDPGTAKWKKRLAALGPLGVAAIFILGKMKFLIPLLKVTKLGTLLSMLVAVWAYTLFWGLPFALGFVLLIFVHEMGHALVMRQQGVQAGAPVFIPFVGAVIAMKSHPRNAWVEALIGIGGPALGTVGALVCLLVAWSTGSLFWYALASTGFLINMFNMIPISPLDGGRIVGVISRWIWLAGYAVGIAIFFVTYSPILFLILLLGLMGLKRAIQGPREGYFDVESNRRLAMGVAYFGLLALMALGMWIADMPLEEMRAAGLGGY